MKIWENIEKHGVLPVPVHGNQGILRSLMSFILLHHCTGDLDDGESLRALIISMEELFGMHIVAALLVFVKNSDVIPL